MRPTTTATRANGANLSFFLVLFLALFVGSFLTSAPASPASAQTSATPALEITEVMYNAPGSDQGAEWVEITNTTNAAIAIAGFKFFQGGVNHGITFASGDSTLAAGESAIIADDTAKFLTDYPAYSGPLFKSSFSLLNTSGTLEIKNASSTIIDSVSYAASMGADGDGNSLHRVGDTFAPGAPNPGSTAPTKPIVKAVVASTASTKTPATSHSSAKSSTQNADDSGADTFVATADIPASPAGTALWWYLLGLGALAALATAGVLYARSAMPSRAETSALADEFDIE